MKSEINLSLWEHQLQNLYDASVKVRPFSFPIFGLETDRDLVWVLFPLVGIIGYYIVLLALGSNIRLFSFLMDRNKADVFRLRLIQSTLVITAPLQDTKSNPAVGDIDPVTKWMWKVLALAVLSIPVVISVLMIIDQANLIPAWVFAIAGEKALKNPSLGFEVELVVEALLIVFELLIAWTVAKAGLVFGKCQTEVSKLINEVESRPGE
jgi:hypothetical protein